MNMTANFLIAVEITGMVPVSMHLLSSALWFIENRYRWMHRTKDG